MGKKVVKNVRVRKLTERECGRLMDIDDEDIDKLKEVATTLINGTEFKINLFDYSSIYSYYIILIISLKLYYN